MSRSAFEGVAYVLWAVAELGESEPARFWTRSGLLTCRKCGDEIEMEFPAKGVAPASPPAGPAGLLQALGVAEPQFVGSNRMDYLVVVRDEQTVRSIAPDFARLAAVDARGVIVTSPSSDARFDFVSRFFAPRVGVNEDPVTGSAHCALGPYWAAVVDKVELRAYQASRRGGAIGVRVAGDRVFLCGRGAMVWRGELLV